ncbi:MAG: hypothetical protein JW910_01775 [Anaerolineae bacterium]|nr:hypothetical protein [Anaerolineae bacterium]
MRCPRCQGKLTYHRPIDALYCWTCGYQQPASPAERQQHGPQENDPIAPPSRTARDFRPPITIKLPPRLDLSKLRNLENDYQYVRLRGRCFEAMHALAGGDAKAIRAALNKILEINDGYPDAWLHLAALAEDAGSQRYYLEQALASEPANAAALAALLRLNLRDQTGEAERKGPHLEPGQAAAVELKCPQCGGQLGYNVAERAVFCRHCGHRIVDADDLTRTDTSTTVMQGIIRRKLERQRWNIGGRWLRCAECGATTTISRQTLTNTCRFCQSRQVLQESVNHAFEQPDLIVPFATGEQEAHAAVEHYLRSGLRRITRFFTEDVRRIALHGVYLPFWVFDADMIVHWSWTRSPSRGQHPVLLSDILHFAGNAPGYELVHQTEPYGIRHGVDYDPRLLAAHPAELYSVDMTRASLDVRRKLGKRAIRFAEPSVRLKRPTRGYGSSAMDGTGLLGLLAGDGEIGRGNSDDPGRLNMHATTQFLTYRLALLPVWIGTLEEADGVTRQVLVNGQTGRVTLGERQKSALRTVR